MNALDSFETKMENSLQKLNEIFQDKKTQIDFFNGEKPIWIFSVINPNNLFLSISIIFEFNSFKGEYEYYIGINKKKLAVIFTDNSILGIDSFSTLEEVIDVFMEAMNNYYFVIFTGLYDVPNMIIPSSQFKEAKKELPKIINANKAGVFSSNFTGCARVDFYKFDGLSYLTIYPNQIKFRTIKCKERVNNIFIGYWLRNDIYQQNYANNIQFGYLEFDEARTIYLKNEKGSISFAVSFDMIGCIRLGYIFDKTFEQILDSTGHLLLTICDEETLNILDVSKEIKDKACLGFKQYALWLSSYSNNRMLDTGKYNSYLTATYYEFIFNTFN